MDDVFADVGRASRWYRWFFATMCGVVTFFGVGFFALWFSQGDGSNLLSGVVLTPPSVWMMVRVARVGIALSRDGDGIVVRGEFRTRRLAWRDIDHFSLEWSGHLLPWHEFTVKLRDGSQLAFPALSELRLSSHRRSRLDRIVAGLNERVRVEDPRSPRESSAPSETT